MFDGRNPSKVLVRCFGAHRAQRALDEAFGSGLVTLLLPQDGEFGAMFIDCTPQQAVVRRAA
ncbi:hypothetical protein G2912_06690 [Paraburkholderia aspalathi]|nr:hypothetical protein [Paraburkholderia aspalathi]